MLAGSIIGNILSVIVAILILLITITVHEFGHYIVGKILKFKISEFAIGMGPAIFKRTRKNGEIFSIRVFPLGGFCAFEGEDDAGSADLSQSKKRGNNAINAPTSQNGEEVFDGIEAEKKEIEVEEAPKPLSENAFSNKKPWQRILVLLAGATMNFIFAIILITVKLVGYGHFELAPAEILPGAFTVGETLQADDAILKMDGKFVYLSTDLVDILNGKKKGDLVQMEVVRNGERKTVTVSLLSDVNCDGMSDVDPCFNALGFGTVVTVKTGELSPIKNGSYLFRFAEYTDEADYQKCTRIYSLDDLYWKLKTLGAGESLPIWTYFDGDEKRTLVYLTAPSDYDTVDKESMSAVLGAFFIESKPAEINYQASTVSVKLGFFEALYRAPAYAFKTLWVTLKSFAQLLTGKIAITEISGPVGTVTITSQFVSSWRFDYILEIAALIGVSIAVFNVLPIPALDGARTVFVIIEWIRKKPIPAKIEGTIHFVGLIALILFAVIVDVLHFIL